ncbi:MAG: molybdopterin-dependent oxidoreductase [Thermodesulfobacteriaceae bacterium]|jgi:anaerobic selenocysteine-containing dehydrogenase
MEGIKVDRREFLKCSALLGGSLLATQLEWAQDLIKRAEAGQLTPEELYQLSKAENQLYTVCLQCNTGCGIKVKLFRRGKQAIAVKIDGNPYNPWNTLPWVPMNTNPKEVAKVDTAICPRGQAGIQTVYDPYRITKVLKRAGRRGENKWITIPFEQAIDEIVNGGYLFKHVPGEENRYVKGLKDYYVLRDPKLAKEMADAVKKIWAAKDKKKAVEEFKAKFKDHLHVLIDPDHPDLGPKNNQIIYFWGRQKGGRSHFVRRFFERYLGTVNAHGHTTVCQGSLYYACQAMSEQYEYNKFGGGRKFYWQADQENSKFILFIGANLFDGNYGPTNRTVRITERLAKGELTIAVADPRFSKLASKAKYYLPVKPGTDGALCMAIIQWIIKNKKYDAKYLSCANKAAAKEAGEPTWCNATWLVKIDKDGNPTTFLRAHEVGLAEPKKVVDKDGKEHTLEFLVVMKDGKPIPFDPNDDKNPVYGDLFVDTEIKGIRVKSALQILKESAEKHTFEEWAKICDVDPKLIEAVANELTKYGKKAAVDVHRGIAQHTNGFYGCTAAMNINLLLGNFDWKGGVIAGATYAVDGSRKGQPFDFRKMMPNALTPFGISIIRHKVKYEDTTLFEGYPAKRNWYPLASDIYQEIITSIGDAYPYPCGVLFSYMAAPTYALPAGHTNIEILADVNKVPLHIACDIIIGTTSMYADYIFPDLSYLERWEFHGTHFNMPAKVQPVRQPVVAPITETVKVFGEEMPICWESLLLAIAEKLNLPGYGENGFGPGIPFKHMDDMYIRMVANIAMEEPAVPDASDEEVELFIKAREHLPKSVFDVERWKRIAGPYFKKVVYILNRGGRFQDYKEVYQGEQVANKYGRLVNMYQEKTAGTKNSITGKPNPGYATYIPIMAVNGKTPEELGLTEGYDLYLITQRDITQTKTRTIPNYWLLEVYPENFILINPVDAKRLGLKDGDKVKVVSATNPEGVWDLKNGIKKPMEGKVKITETIRPGVITFTLGHGHWATGASDFYIDGKLIKGDPKRATGINANAAMWIDPYLKNTCFFDPVGGSVSFYDTKVKLVKV